MYSLKRGLFLTIITFVVLSAVLIFVLSGISFSTIVGSKHDLSFNGTGDFTAIIGNEDEVCIFCHTPHNAIVDDGFGNKLPLWNRTILRNTSGFTLYSSSTLNATLEQPRSMTLLCLSCHDGITAVNALVNYGRFNPITMSGGFDQLGDIFWSPGGVTYPGDNIGGAYPASPNIKDLSDDHPISFVFDNSLVIADGGLQLPPAGDAVKLFNGRLECATCHNVHEEGTAGDMPFLRKSNDGSALCITCHLK